MPLRNPFKRVSVVQVPEPVPVDAGFRDADLVGTKPVEPEPAIEYQLSEINDSGVFLPPAPAEKPSFWQARSSSSLSSSMHRSFVSDDEPFNMSRESFDSYRRSFDISARSPMSDSDVLGRGSLDSSFSAPPQQQQRRKPDWPPQSGDDAFEEVKLNEEARPTATAPVSRRRALFAKFGGSAGAPLAPPPPSSAPLGVAAPHHVFPLFSSRRPGPSVQGAEMATIPQDRELETVEGNAAVVDAVAVQ